MNTIPDSQIPRAAVALMQHAIDTYASETNKTASVFREFADADLAFRPHDKSMTAVEIMKHELLSERRFFADFLGSPEPSAADTPPKESTAAANAARLIELAQPRLGYLAQQSEHWWLGRVTFFDVERPRVWVLWRRILHSAHHRTQLTVYLRLLSKPVPSVYGPTADVTWTGADPTIR